MPALTNARTGTQHVEDAAHASGDIGHLVFAVRSDAGGPLAGDGDYHPLLTDAVGRLRVAVSGAAGGTSAVDDSAFTVAVDSVTPAGGIYRSVRDAVDDNDVGALAMTQKRGLYVSIETPLADSAMDDVNDAVRVNMVAGGGAGGTSMIDDAAFTPAVTGITPMGAFADEVAPDSVDEGDAGIVRMSLNRNLYVSLRDAAGNERGLNVDAAGSIAVTDGGGALSVDDNGGALTVDGTVTVQDGGGSISVDDGGGVLSVDDNGASLTVDNATISVVGGGAEATAQRVTIANDSTGQLTVDDGGGSLTVDGGVTADIRDGAGVALTSTLVGADQALDVNVVQSVGGAGGTSMVDDAAFTPAVTNITPMGAFADEVAPDSVDEGDAGVVRMSLNRNLYTVLRDAAGNERGANITAANELNVANAVLSVVGGGAEATAQRVTIANNSTGVLSVDDNAGSLTVDNAALSVTGGGVEAGTLRVTIANDSTGLLSVDDNGSSLTVDGAGTAMVDDAAFSIDNDLFTPVGGTYRSVRDSVDDNDAGIFAMTATRALYASLETPAGDSAMDEANDSVNVTIVAGGATGGTAMQDDTAFSIGNDDFTPVGGTYRSVRDAVDDNDGGMFAMTQTRALYAALETPNGDSAMDEANDSVNVTIVAGGGAGGTAQADDAAFTPAVDNVTPMGAFADEVAPDSVDEGDIGAVRMSLNRNLYTQLRDAAGNERGVNVTAANELNVANAALSVVGGGAEATAQRVTIADDSTGVLSVDDNAGSLTVDNAALSVLGGGAEAGTLRVTIANDSTGLLSVDDNGNSLTVDGAGTSMVDDAGFTVEVDLVTPIGALYDSSGIDSVDEDDIGVVRMSANRNLFINLQDAAGNERGANVNASNELTVANSVLSVVGGGAEATAQRVTIANDSTGLLSIDDNGGTLTVDSANHDSFPVNANMQIGDADAAVGNPVPVAGTAAEAAAVAGNPVLVGGRHHASVVAGDAVGDGEAVRQLSDSVGGTVRGHRADAWSANANYGAAQTDAEVKATPGANLYLYVTDILFTTEGANNIFLESAAATIVPTVYLAANGGWTGHFQTPIRWPVNTAITITSSAAVNHSVLISGYTAPI